MFVSTDCTVILGQRGSGKTYLGKMLQSAWPRRVVIDLTDEYDHDQDTVWTFDEFCEKLEFHDKEKSENFKIIFKSDPENSISEGIFNEIMRLCYYKGNLLIVIEEIQEYCTPHEIPSWLRQCYLTGRHQNIAILCTSQRPAYVNKTVVALSDHKFFGRCSEANDLRYIASIIDTENAQKLRNLQNRNFFHYSKDGVKLISTEN